jgi:SAM-dependent methyltransferase
MPLQQSFWNGWNASTRERELPPVSLRQKEVVSAWLSGLRRDDLDMIDIGCGAGWLCSDLTRFGQVTGTDLADEVLVRARQRVPRARFIAGDFMQLSFPAASFDVAVVLEVLSHVSDQAGFIERVSNLLRPGGYLMLATQNRPMMEHCRVDPVAPGQIRHWLDRTELCHLLRPGYEILELFTVAPRGGKGWGLFRIMNSVRLERAITPVAGQSFNRLKEAAGLGSILMALARKRGDAPVDAA